MYWGDQIRKNEMDRVCGMHGGQERCIKFLVGNLNDRDHLEKGKCMWNDNNKMEYKYGMGRCGQD